MPRRNDIAFGGSRDAQKLEGHKPVRQFSDVEPCPCLDCCYDYRTIVEISSANYNIGLDKKSNHIMLKGDTCSYYKITVTGEWGVNPADNDASTDYSNDNNYGGGYTSKTEIYAQILKLEPDRTNMSVCKSEAFDNGGGTGNIVISKTWIIATDDDMNIMFNLSQTNDATFDEKVEPTQNYDNYFKTIEVEKCPKDQWFGRWVLPETPGDNTDDYIYESIPPKTQPAGSRDMCEGLPFGGYFHVDLYVTFKEYDEVEGQYYYANTSAMQQLGFYDSVLGWFGANRSAVYSQETTPESCWVNTALQTSAIIGVDPCVNPCSSDCCENNRLWFSVYLPNGTYKYITGGYVHIHWIGNEEGEICEWDCSESEGETPPAGAPPTPPPAVSTGGANIQ